MIMDGSKINIGDLVGRKVSHIQPGWKNQIAQKQRKELGLGIVLEKNISGNPPHPCITVFYPKAGKCWDIAESLMEVISESR